MTLQEIINYVNRQNVVLRPIDYSKVKVLIHQNDINNAIKDIKIDQDIINCPEESCTHKHKKINLIVFTSVL